MLPLATLRAEGSVWALTPGERGRRRVVAERQGRGAGCRHACPHRALLDSGKKLMVPSHLTLLALGHRAVGSFRRWGDPPPLLPRARESQAAF